MIPWKQAWVAFFNFLLYSGAKRQVTLFKLLLHEESNNAPKIEKILKSPAKLRRLVIITSES